MKDDARIRWRFQALVAHCPLFASIRGRLYLLVLSVLIPVVLIQAGYLYTKFKTRRANELQANMEVARSAAQTFERFVQDILHQEEAIGINLTIPQVLPITQMNQILKANMAEYPAVRNFSWLDPEGHIVASSMELGIGLDLSDREHIKQIILGREWVVSDLMLSRATGEPIFSISRATQNRDGELLGIVTAAIEADNLGNVLSVNLSNQGVVDIIDSQGMLVYQHPWRKWDWGERSAQKNGPAVRQALEDKEVTGIFRCCITGERQMVALRPIYSLGWIARVGRPEAVVMTPVKSQIFRQAGLLSILTIVLLLGPLVLSQKLARSIRKLWEHALAVGSGELERRIEISGPTELKDLASAFNAMAEKIEVREEALKASRQRLESVLEAIPASVYLQAPDYSIRFANRNFRDVWGDPEGKHCYELLRGQTESCENCGVVCTFDTQTPQQWEWTDPCGKSYVIHSYPFTDYDGSPAVLKLSLDVSELKQAEKAKKKISDELESIFNSTPASVFYKDTKNNFIRANKAAADLAGLRAEDIEGKSADELFPLHAEKYYLDDLEVIESGSPRIGIVERLRDSSGETKWVRTDKVPVKDDQGSVTGLIVFSLDITEQKRAEEALRESEERYHGVFRAAKDAIVVLDQKTGRVINANEFACELYGYSLDEMLSLRNVDLSSQPDLTLAALAAGVDRIPLRYHRKKDGTIFPVEISASYLTEKNRSISISVIRDISERMKAEGALKNSERELRFLSSRLLSAQEEERKRIAGELHDSIGASLGTIRLSLENTLNQVQNGAVTPEYIQEIISLVEQTAEDARQIYMNLRPSMLDHLGIIPTISWFMRQFESANPVICTDKHIEVEEERIPDPIKIVIFRTVQESLHNIAKYSGADHVSASLTETSGSIELAICDNGVGFDVDAAFTMKRDKGGLGLTSMRERVQLSGGVFAVESTIGNGTTVSAVWKLSGEP